MRSINNFGNLFVLIAFFAEIKTRIILLYRIVFYLGFWLFFLHYFILFTKSLMIKENHVRDYFFVYFVKLGMILVGMHEHIMHQFKF